MPKATISDKDLERMLESVDEAEAAAARKDPKRKWVNQIMRSAKKYHKLCPYYDKRTNKCFLKLGGKCDRAGKLDGCPVFIEYLEKKYDEIKAKGKPLPMDFLDLVLV